MYINGLTNDLSSNAKFFDTSMFFVVSNLDASAEKLNDNLAKVQDWTLENNTAQKIKFLIKRFFKKCD